jgi:hypothetical protein
MLLNCDNSDTKQTNVPFGCYYDLRMSKFFILSLRRHVVTDMQ